MTKKLNKISLLLVLAIAFIGCSGSEFTIKDSNPSETSDDSIKNDEISSNDAESLSLISSLSDIYSSNQNNIPTVFSEIKKEKEVEVDLTKGFRVQIYSGENVFEADTIAATFRAWSDTTLIGYQAETYTFFKSPYYKVHIGDFHDRTRALRFSKMVKRLFRDAWVVYDTVDPYLVPEDTTNIEFQDL